MNSENMEEQMTPEQEARVNLRKSFLKAVYVLNGKTCSILTYEMSTLSGTFSGWKPDGCEALIHDLKTPANIKISSALLRTPDILAIQFDNPVQLQI